MISRRRLLWGGVGLAGLGAVGWGAGHWALEAQIASILHRRLSYLHLDPDGVKAFAKDQTATAFAKKIPTWNRLRYHLLAGSDASFKRFYRSADKRSRREKLEDNLVSTYLLSSDFFSGGMDESSTVKYIVYYDPVRPCQNPFARPAVDPSTA